LQETLLAAGGRRGAARFFQGEGRERRLRLLKPLSALRSPLGSEVCHLRTPPQGWPCHPLGKSLLFQQFSGLPFPSFCFPVVPLAARFAPQRIP